MARQLAPDIDPERFQTRWYEGRGFRQAFVHEGRGGVALLLIHGWPETKRLYWRVIQPLAAAGFEVIVPDLRGFGESEIGPDGLHDAPSSSRDLHALVTDGLGHDKIVVAGADFGGVIAQDFSHRFPDLVDRMVIANCPLPYDREAMAGLRTRGAPETLDYYHRQGTDGDELLAELSTPQRRRRYIAAFYTSRLWAHPGAFTSVTSGLGEYPDVEFHTEPFGDGPRLRASWGAYESRYNPGARSEPVLMARNDRQRALILYGPSDPVIAPDFDRMAATIFPNHVGPFLLRDCGHFVPWEAAHAFATATIAFCSDLLGARASQ